MKLQTKIWLGTGAVIILIMALDVALGYWRIKSSIYDQQYAEARIVRAMLMATRHVYHEQFLSSDVPLSDKTIGFLPAHAISRISAEFPNWIESGLTFNNVSDRPRNPHNQADADELAAMAWFQENLSELERITEIRNKKGAALFHYTAPIWIESYCLKCHGDRNDAPPTIREKYSNAYGYKLGDLRGVLSIKLPRDELRSHIMAVWWQQFGVRAGGYAALLLLIGFLMNQIVTRRLARLDSMVHRLEAGDLDARVKISGGDEVATLASSFNSMAAALERNINERKHAEEAIRDFNQSLSQQVQEEATKNREKDLLLIQQSRLASMGEMMQNVAHQWRQPLNTVGLVLQNIQADYDDGLLDKESLNNLISDGFKVVQQMSTTIDNFRNFFMSETEKKRFRLCESLTGVMNMVEDSFKNNNITIINESCGLPCFVEGYPNEFQQVVLNALSNAKEAIVARKIAGKIRLNIEMTESHATLSILDNGGGIPQKIIGRVFDPYFTTKEGGTGIGLYMSKMIMEKMNGEIAIRNKEGGAEVRLSIPLGKT